MRNLILWGVTVWLVIEALLNVALIGKPRDPKTPWDAILAIVSIAVWVGAFHYVASAS